MAEIKAYTTEEVIEILHVTRRTLYNYIKGGQIKAVKIGRSWRFTEDAVKEFLEKGTQPDYLKQSTSENIQ